MENGSERGCDPDCNYSCNEWRELEMILFFDTFLFSQTDNYKGYKLQLSPQSNSIIDVKL